jgi:murein DD-endopeptidase MepM/ murein hydrolase activator NlpD
MRSASNNFRSRPYRLALTAGIVGAALSACSQDTSRFNDDPFTNPFSSRSDVTNSVPSSAGRVESRPLAGPQSHGAYTPPPNYASNPPRTVPAAPAQTYRPQQASYHPATTGSNPPAIQGGDAGWAWDGGTAVTLQHGESVETVARRYGVPVSAILRANNFSDASRITPGMRIVIPSYQGVGQSHAQAPQPSQQTYNPPPPRQQTYTPPPPRQYSPPPAQPRASAQSGATHVVNPGETLYSLGRRYGVSHVDIANANGIHNETALRVGQRLTIPGSGNARASTTTPFSPPPAPRAEAPAPTQRTAASPEPAQKAAAITPVSTSERDEPRSLGGSPQFRWPVRGRVISGYGPKSNGQHNDGINLAVPEGTEVKAAEDGVVAYAGNELKGYGNLVLLRHSDGWMTAYAHNSQLLVKRGDTVKRGQNIARAGQTGGVSSPQVHFEIRKGSTPVDPKQYLAEL